MKAQLHISIFHCGHSSISAFACQMLSHAFDGGDGFDVAGLFEKRTYRLVADAAAQPTDFVPASIIRGVHDKLAYVLLGPEGDGFKFFHVSIPDTPGEASVQ